MVLGARRGMRVPHPRVCCASPPEPPRVVTPAFRRSAPNAAQRSGPPAGRSAFLSHDCILIALGGLASWAGRSGPSGAWDQRTRIDAAKLASPLGIGDWWSGGSTCGGTGPSIAVGLTVCGQPLRAKRGSRSEDQRLLAWPVSTGFSDQSGTEAERRALNAVESGVVLRLLSSDLARTSIARGSAVVDHGSPFVRRPGRRQPEAGWSKSSRVCGGRDRIGPAALGCSRYSSGSLSHSRCVACGWRSAPRGFVCHALWVGPRAQRVSNPNPRA